jgi:hypothetical protein
MKAFIAGGFLVLSMFVSFSFSQTDTSAKPTIALFSVDSMVFAAGIDARSPVGVAAQFQSTTGKVSCWIKVSSSQGPISVKFVWNKDGQKVFELPITLKPQSGRLWSTKTVTPGNWQVDIVDDASVIAKSGTFVVQ